MKRCAALLLCLGLLLSLAGCSLFDQSNYELTAYTAETEEVVEADVDYISDYATLKRVITWLVSEHQESAELQFQNYDGNISRDISQACWEVKSSTPLGAWAIDYTSCDLSRIVSFYQADLYITYRRSSEQMEALEQLSGLTELSARLNRAFRSGESYLALQIPSATLTADLVRDTVSRTYYSDGLAALQMPQAEVSLYPESGVERIVEIRLDYGMDTETLAQQRQELQLVCAEALEYTGASGEASSDPDSLRDADRLYAACQYLQQNCIFSSAAGATAFDALVKGAANAEGMAMACQALCSLLELPCRVVEGRRDNEPHFWNMVTVDGESYHVDLSDPEGLFLVGDEQMLGLFWWDTELYPACPNDYDYFGHGAALEAAQSVSTAGAAIAG